MGCISCPEDVWICSEDEPDCDATFLMLPDPAADPAQAAVTITWNRVGCVHLSGGDYYVKCKPGSNCGARVEADNLTDPGWKLLNDVPLSLLEGHYLLCCARGDGTPCTVRLRRYSTQDDCDSASC